MNLSEFFSRKRMLFILLFGVIALISYQINFSSVLGVENQFFTLFQFFGPIAGAFLGPVAGAISVLLAEIGNFVLVGKSIELMNLLRLSPMLFAAYYFGKKARFPAIVSLICMVAFMLHPIGGQAWVYCLYWLIPAIMKFLPDRLFLKSLGTTFTAHAVGSTLFLYAVPMSVEFWLGLIPVVAFERIMFALGITFSFIAMTTVLNKVSAMLPEKVVFLDKKYILNKTMLGLKA